MPKKSGNLLVVVLAGGGLLVVLGLVGVFMVGMLAAIAIPNFVVFQLRAKRAEVPATVDAIRLAELAWHAEHGTWLPVSSEAEATAGLGGETREWAGGGAWEQLGWAPTAPLRGGYWVEVEGDTMHVWGVADLDSDGEQCVYVATEDSTASARMPGRVY